MRLKNVWYKRNFVSKRLWYRLRRLIKLVSNESSNGSKRISNESWNGFWIVCKRISKRIMDPFENRLKRPAPVNIDMFEETTDRLRFVSNGNPFDPTFVWRCVWHPFRKICLRLAEAFGTFWQTFQLAVASFERRLKSVWNTFIGNELQTILKRVRIRLKRVWNDFYFEMIP